MTGIASQSPASGRATALKAPTFELVLVLLGFSAITAAFFYPMSAAPGDWVYRPDNGDGQFSIWNVAWVAHALLDDPRDLLNAEYFLSAPRHARLLGAEPRRRCSGVTGVWITRSAYAAHNSAVLASFVLSATSTYYLCRHLVQDRRAAVVGAICFAFCPYLIAHLLHVQLLMTAFLPLSLLAFHRLADRPTAARGAVLGLAMTGQVVACQVTTRCSTCCSSGSPCWSPPPCTPPGETPGYWKAIGVAAVVAGVTTVPVAWPFVTLSQTGFSRSFENTQQFSADWRAYLHPPPFCTNGCCPFSGAGRTSCFPVSSASSSLPSVSFLAWKTRQELGNGAAVCGFRGAGLLGLLRAGGRTVPRALSVVPGFSLMRAASRFGLLVVLALSVLAALAVQQLLARSRRPAILAAALLLATAADRTVRLSYDRTQPFEAAYHVLSLLPDGPLIELPVYSRLLGFRRSLYMLNSTVHWKPLVDAYSDYIPEDFTQRLEVLGDFPTEAALRDLAGIAFATP